MNRLRVGRTRAWFCFRGLAEEFIVKLPLCWQIEGFQCLHWVTSIMPTYPSINKTFLWKISKKRFNGSACTSSPLDFNAGPGPLNPRTSSVQAGHYC